MIEYRIEKTDGVFTLYSVVKTNFGGEAINYIRSSKDRSILEHTISQLEKLAK